MSLSTLCSINIRVNMRKILFPTLLLLFSLKVSAQKIAYTLTNAGDTTKNYYLTVHPEGEVKGFLLLLPGFGESPKQVLIESDIHIHASKAGYLTLIPALGDWSFFYIDKQSHEKLNQLLSEVFNKYKLYEKPFFIGGFSFGGNMALQYTQAAYQPTSPLQKPTGVFAIDPPLDIARLYTCMTTSNRPAKNPISVEEDQYIANRIKQVFQQDPQSNPSFFWSISPYAQSDPEHSSLKTLGAVPLRIYNEPDINWYIENRQVDYACMNVMDSAGLINWLRSKGNKKAELIISTNKGYRKSRYIKHPHSWSIVEGAALVEWMNKLSK